MRVTKKYVSPKIINVCIILITSVYSRVSDILVLIDNKIDDLSFVISNLLAVTCICNATFNFSHDTKKLSSSYTLLHYLHSPRSNKESNLWIIEVMFDKYGYQESTKRRRRQIHMILGLKTIQIMPNLYSLLVGWLSTCWYKITESSLVRFFIIARILHLIGLY